MQRQRKVIRIPKDPTTENTIFISEIPLDLVKILDCEEWKSCIEEINQVFLDAEAPSIWNAVKLFLVIPAFFRIKTYEQGIEKAISKVNYRLRSKGIYFENPTSNGYNELVVVYTIKDF